MRNTLATWRLVSRRKSQVIGLLIFSLSLGGWSVECLAPKDPESIRSAPLNRLGRDSVSEPVRTSFGKTGSRRKQESLEQGNNPLISLNLNLDSLAQSGAAPRAQELLERIQALYQEGYYEVSPDVVSYNSVLKAWKEDNNPQQAYELLQDMLRIEADEIQVDVISLNTVILAFAKTGDYPQAEDLLRQMQRRKDLPDPDTVTFNSVLYAFSVSKEPGTAQEAEHLLKEMMKEKSAVKVDTTSFNTVIYAFSQMAGDNKIAPAHRSQQLLEHMERLSAAGNTNVDPDVYSYTTVMHAYAKCGQPAKAIKVWDRMAKRGLTPNRFTYTSIMSSFAKAGKPLQAEAILKKMMRAYINGNDDLKPDTVAFSSVMDGWAKLSHVDQPEAATHALDLLKRMKAQAHRGMGPNARTYTSCLTALAKSGRWDACLKAQTLLDEMEDEFHQGNRILRPTVIHFNAVLMAFARSPRADKAILAAEFFEKMRNHPDPQCRPDTISHNSLLMACANGFGDDALKKKAYLIARSTYDAVLDADPQSHTFIQPTSTTFAHFCKAARRLLHSKEQHAVLKEALRLCCQKGLLNHVVVQQVQMACRSEGEWSHLSGDLSQYVQWKEKFKAQRLPRKWVCNARR